MGKTYFSGQNRFYERLMQERPGTEPGGKRQIIQILRCENCSAYDKDGETCRLPTCRFRPPCEECPYRKGICNVCYREMMKEI